MRNYLRIAILMIASISFANLGSAQCENWNESPQKDDAENNHSIYRQALKAEDFPVAEEYWAKAFEVAPAADGKRDYHFTDGIKIYINKLKDADATTKSQYVDKINMMYDQVIECYRNGAIKPTKCQDDACIEKRIGNITARRAFDMYYSINAPYSKNLEMYDQALNLAGNDIEYTFFDPVATMAVYQFEKGKIDKQQTLDYFFLMEKIAEHNLANNEKYGEYYDQGWKAAKTKFGKIETQLFDCEYFKPQIQARYDENPKDPDNLKTCIALLKKRGCSDADPTLMKWESEWKSYAQGVNAQRQADFEASNPAMLASKAYKAGDYPGAIAKYREAINQATDNVKKGTYHCSIASIMFRKQKKYNDARKEAKTALGFRPGWGKALMLIGDMYATGARNCGDSWNQRLAILAAVDKYRAASSDPEYAADANSKISKYSSSKPTQDEGFMRGVKKGDRVTVGCWIGESVKVSYQ